MAESSEKYHNLDYVPTEEEKAQEKAQAAQALLEILNDPEKFREATKSIFRDSDINRDGSIDRAELREFLSEFTKCYELPAVSEEALDEELASLDTDSSGTLDISEYSVLVRRLLEKLYQICLS
jgi:Ca2+-binding EF-hand superfamily protein